LAAELYFNACITSAHHRQTRTNRYSENNRHRRKAPKPEGQRTLSGVRSKSTRFPERLDDRKSGARSAIASSRATACFRQQLFDRLSSEFKLAWKLDFCRHFRRAAEENSHLRKVPVEDNDAALLS